MTKKTQAAEVVAEEIPTVTATFVGNGDNDPSSVEYFERTFPANQEVDVSDMGDFIIAKLKGNSHFDVVTDGDED